MEKATMRRVVVKAFGGPEQLTVEPAADAPRPGPGQVLVEVEAAGVNYLDVMQRKGAPKRPLPYTPGLEASGGCTRSARVLTPPAPSRSASGWRG
jgi:NADPH:quinone reductase